MPVKLRNVIINTSSSNFLSGAQRTKRSTATLLFHGETAAAAENDVGSDGTAAPETDPASHCQAASRLQTAGSK